MIDPSLEIIGRQGAGLFAQDIAAHAPTLAERVGNGRFLVIGGAGSIGQAVVKQILLRSPRACHVVDLSENNLVELVRDVRSSMTNVTGDFLTLPLDFASVEFQRFVAAHGPYDYVLNLAAMKHVRSEKDPYSLMRMIRINVLDIEPLLRWAAGTSVKKYFAVSTDKAANPANLMGATKRLMELALYRVSADMPISTARFANVAFSDGSLLHGFHQRLLKHQPIAAPNDVRRYFVTFEEAGQLCLMSCMLGDNRDLFFPKLDEQVHMITFSEIAERYLKMRGYTPVPCASEAEAIRSVDKLAAEKCWPVYFFKSDTTGEKAFEEFYTADEQLDMNRFAGVGVIQNPRMPDTSALDAFRAGIAALAGQPTWKKEQFVQLFRNALPNLEHEETGKNLDQKM